jgi:hypothetical protein
MNEVTVAITGRDEKPADEVNYTTDDGNPDEVDPAEEEVPEEEVPSAELSSEGEPFEANSDEDESNEEPEDLPTTELVVSPLVKEEPRAAAFSANAVGGFDQRFMPIRYGLSDNGTRSSRKRPMSMSKHLTIKLPDGWSRIFQGVWIAQREEDAMILSLFARSDQNGRDGYKSDCAWKWYKVKPSDEVAIGVSRCYTLSRLDDVLIHDYDVGAFRLHLPHEPEPSDHGAVQLHRPMFG